MNKTTIKITQIQDHGRNHDMYCDKVLMLRNARHPGDTEVVNNYVLSKLRLAKSVGTIDFEESK